MGLGFRLLVSDGDNYARNAVASYLSGVERMSYIFRGTLYIQHTCERPRVSATTAIDHAHLAPELLVLGLERDSRRRQPFVHRGILQREYLARRVPPIDLIVRYSM